MRPGEYGVADPGADGLQWQDLGSGFEIGRGFRHAVNHRGCGILSNRESAGIAQGKQTLSAVPAHAGKQNADAGPALRMGKAGEEYIDGRSVGVVARVLRVGEKAAAPIVFFKYKVAASACDPDSAQR